MLSSDPNSIIDDNESNIVGWRKSLTTKARDTKAVSPPERIAQQRELLNAAHSSSEDLVLYLRRNLNLEGVDLSNFPELKTPLGPAEYKSRLLKTALELHGALNGQGCTRRQAAAGSYWLYCIIRWMEQDLLPNPPAAELIRRTVETDLLDDNYKLKPEQSTHLDNCIRDFLRFTGGIPHVRDRTSYMSDCPAAHMWWAVELSNEIITIPGITYDRDTILEYFLKIDIMAEIIRWTSRLVGRLSQPLALAAAFEAAIGKGREQADDKELRQIMEKLARRGRRWRLDKDSPITVPELVELSVS